MTPHKEGIAIELRNHHMLHTVGPEPSSGVAEALSPRFVLVQQRLCENLPRVLLFVLLHNLHLQTQQTLHATRASLSLSLRLISLRPGSCALFAPVFLSIFHVFHLAHRMDADCESRPAHSKLHDRQRPVEWIESAGECVAK